jgi:hypothetical protein
MSTSKKLKQFHRAKLKKFSNFCFDIGKSLIIGTLGTLIFEDWQNIYAKLIVLFAGIFATTFSIIIALKYLRSYYSHYDRD